MKKILFFIISLVLATASASAQTVKNPTDKKWWTNTVPLPVGTAEHPIILGKTYSTTGRIFKKLLRNDGGFSVYPGLTSGGKQNLEVWYLQGTELKQEVFLFINLPANLDVWESIDQNYPDGIPIKIDFRITKEGGGEYKAEPFY